MKRIGEIDAFSLGRPSLSDEERKNINRAKSQQQKEDGYQHLAELCRLGEYDAARQLANRNPSWGYEIVGGEVMDKSE
ncbi:hypothetical protein [Coleofasciculus sp. FACHB-T130]|uniref:hypothetical protein n=1 Tax=Cyanophyceae TaxID=3028117 RepID=UPI0016820319|nr:hypothetical protein [Coleofasciculus sp. FACHB-T130]MBD1877957.1 hypothetical protein [Coleofasciculus sp. FACHB-T130]